MSVRLLYSCPYHSIPIYSCIYLSKYLSVCLAGSQAGRQTHRQIDMHMHARTHQSIYLSGYISPYSIYSIPFHAMQGYQYSVLLMSSHLILSCRVSPRFISHIISSHLYFSSLCTCILHDITFYYLTQDVYICRIYIYIYNMPLQRSFS